VLEAMKMEIAVAAPFAAVIERLNCAPGNLVTAGQNLVTLRAEAVA
jgi:biotin carboxyl carrier protein